ncbi:MAG: RNA polymerase sigma factor SigJ [Gemmatimonadetes bacterium]|nr:RNA polymerase sigma factor SigJ [Gemmatimonadota bacterium]
MAGPADRAALFERYRARLFGIAYRMLGTVDDANDLVQECYLRWHQADPVAIEAPEGWLVAVITRLAIDRSRRNDVERRSYVGQWLPEPLTIGAPPPTDRRAELASDLSLAFLVMLERLAPEERAAFLLREVLGVEYAELARVLDRSEAACRQMVHRARERVRTERPRFHVSPDAKRELLERFVRALEREDRDALLAVVAPDATFISDGGGRVRAALRVIQGAPRVVRMLLGIHQKWGDVRDTITWLNGEPALVSYRGDQLVSTTSFDVDGDRIFGFYRVLNPDKLKNLGARRAPLVG